jgi:hypothetical protein
MKVQDQDSILKLHLRARKWSNEIIYMVLFICSGFTLSIVGRWFHNIHLRLRFPKTNKIEFCFLVEIINEKGNTIFCPLVRDGKQRRQVRIIEILSQQNSSLSIIVAPSIMSQAKINFIQSDSS